MIRYSKNYSRSFTLPRSPISVTDHLDSNQVTEVWSGRRRPLSRMLGELLRHVASSRDGLRTVWRVSSDRQAADSDPFVFEHDDGTSFEVDCDGVEVR